MTIATKFVFVLLSRVKMLTLYNSGFNWLGHCQITGVLSQPAIHSARIRDLRLAPRAFSLSSFGLSFRQD